MTSRSAAIVHAADPVAADAFEDAWADPEGRATFERIIADPRPGAAHRPHRRRLVTSAVTIAAAAAAVTAIGVPGADRHHATPARRPVTPSVSVTSGAVVVPAAWTVDMRADGRVDFKLYDFRDPAGLQARFTAIGVPAHVQVFDYACVSGAGSGDEWIIATVLHMPAGNPTLGKNRTFLSATLGPETFRRTHKLWIGFTRTGASSRDFYLVMSTAATTPPCFH